MLLQQSVSSAKHSINIRKIEDLSHKEDVLKTVSANKISLEKVHLNALQELLEKLNPERLLKTGYSINQIDGKDLDHFQPDELQGKSMETLSGRFKILSTIEQVEKRK